MTLTPGHRYTRRDGQTTPPLQPSTHYPGRFFAGSIVWEANGRVAGAAESGWDIVGEAANVM